MNANGAGTVKRRLSRAEAERLVWEFEQSGLRRREFCEARGLNVFTLDAWRKRIVQSSSDEKIVPVEIVDAGSAREGSVLTGPGAGHFRVVLAQGLRIEVETGFDAAELRRLIAALGEVQLNGQLPKTV